MASFFVDIAIVLVERVVSSDGRGGVSVAGVLVPELLMSSVEVLFR